RFVLPTDALFAFAQSAIPLICLLLSTLFENKRPLHFIAAIATIDLCWIVATPNTYNFVGKLHAIDMIEQFAKLRAFLFLYA
uniref:Uncharacterized protein n=1 Tax=Plectus sambesii TaxID=2011161 RepID=A0A914XRL4_9BILA